MNLNPRSWNPVGVAIAGVLLIVFGLVWRDSQSSHSARSGSTPAESTVQRATGGIVRVVVSTPPEMSDTQQGGDALRQLILPSLFLAQPDGSWRAGLAAPSSDHLASNQLSATFRLRTGAQWSDGTPITVDDLRRTMDHKFVASVNGPDSHGVITVYFTQRFPGWHRLWSGDAAIRPTNPNLSGGPYVVQSLTSGLETDLVRNDHWWGTSTGAFLDEIDLVLIPDPATARELLAAGKVDVLAPVEDTVRTQRLQTISGVTISENDRSGAWAGLRLSTTHIEASARPTVMSSFPKADFVGSLLAGEVTSIDGLQGNNDHIWTGLSSKTTPLQKLEMTIGSPTPFPLSTLFDRTFQRAVQAQGGIVTISDGTPDQLSQWLVQNNFDAMLELEQDGPVTCWSCHFSDVDAQLAMKADAGDAGAVQSLEKELRDKSILLPLWRPHAVVASRTAVVNGVMANGFVSGVTWDASQWWKPSS